MTNVFASCSICFEVLDKDQISALHCGHTFHSECILRWLETCKACPQCRLPSDEQNMIQRLFFNSGDDFQFPLATTSSNQSPAIEKVSGLEQTVKTLKKEKEILKAYIAGLEVVRKTKEQDEAITNEKIQKLEAENKRLEGLVAYISESVTTLHREMDELLLMKVKVKHLSLLSEGPDQ